MKTSLIVDVASILGIFTLVIVGSTSVVLLLLKGVNAYLDRKERKRHGLLKGYMFPATCYSEVQQRYLPTLRTCSLMPYSCSMSWPTAARLQRKKSILSCSGRLSMMVRWMLSSWARVRVRPTPGLRPRKAGSYS